MGNSREKCGPFDSVKGRFDGHGCMMIVGHQCKAIVAMIARQMSHDCVVIEPRSRGDPRSQSRGDPSSQSRDNGESQSQLDVCLSSDGHHRFKMHQMCPRVAPRCAKITMNRGRPMNPCGAPRSHDVTHTFHLFRPSDEDRKLLMHPRVAR